VPTAPELAVVPPVFAAAADPSRGFFGSTPLYSKMRMSGYLAAELKVTVTVFLPAVEEAIFGE
jgi:hypothetical protein